MTEPNGSRRELKYLREIFMFIICGLVGWTLVSTVETSKNVAVLSESFKNMQVSFNKLEDTVEKATKDRYDSDDAEKDFEKFSIMIEGRTENRYTSMDAERDFKRVQEMIRNHKHN